MVMIIVIHGFPLGGYYRLFPVFLNIWPKSNVLLIFRYQHTLDLLHRNSYDVETRTRTVNIHGLTKG